MKLIIVESPTKANSIKQFLGDGYEVVACKGHIRDIREDPFGVDIDNDFEVAWVYVDKEIIDELKEKASRASEIILATDPDREGEAIAWHLCQVLDIDVESKCRITYQEVTEAAVKNALEEPRSIDMDLFHAALDRSIIDYIIGFKVSPLLWKNYASGLSAGRVQSAVLYLICKQEEQRRIDLEANKNPTHWTLSAKLEKESIEFAVDGTDSFPDEANVKVAKGIAAGSCFVLNNIKESPVRESKPEAPFKTSTLMRSAMSYLGYDTTVTQSLAQDLFEKHHLITYIRTDAVFISEAFQADTREYISNKYGNEYIPDTVPIYQARPDAQEAHEAIRPVSLENTPASVRGNLSDTEYKLYKLIYDRYMASQMKPSKSKSTKYSFKNGDYGFECSSSEYVFDGFRHIYNYGQKQEQKLPSLNVGDKLTGTEINCLPHYRKSTPHYNQASLVEMMETCGIGRPSTYASTIKILKDRGYIEQENKDLIPRYLGEIINDGLQQNFENVFNIEKGEDDTYESFTARMEDSLDSVAHGESNYVEVLKGFWNTFEPTLEYAEDHMTKWKGNNTGKYCPVCGGKLIERISKGGVFWGCDNYSACQYTYNPPEITEKVCDRCGSPMLKRHKQNGTVYYACGNPECNEHAAVENEPLASKPNMEWKQRIVVTHTPVKITKFAKRIKAAAKENGQIFKGKYITDNVNYKFARYGYLELREDKYGIKRYLPTDMGRLLDMTTEDIKQGPDTDELMEIRIALRVLYNVSGGW